MQISLNSPISKKIVDFINKNLKWCASWEAHKTILKHHVQNSYFCIYITKAVWYKCRLYKASEVDRITNMIGNGTQEQQAILKTAREKGYISEQQGDDRVIYEVKYCSQYSQYSEPQINDLQLLVKGFTVKN